MYIEHKTGTKQTTTLLKNLQTTLKTRTTMTKRMNRLNRHFVMVRRVECRHTWKTSKDKSQHKVEHLVMKYGKKSKENLILKQLIGTVKTTDKDLTKLDEASEHVHNLIVYGNPSLHK